VKKERIKKRIYRTREIAKTEISDDIDMFYSRTRRHSHLSGISPEAFEAVLKQA
jgi:putative transposase